MNKFAFIVHPLSVRNFCELSGKLRSLVGKLPRQAAKSLLKIMSPYSFIYINDIKSEADTKVGGYGIMCPLLPEQFVMLDEETVIKKIISAARLGERLGARIVGLGGFTSIVGNEGERVANELNIAVTTGNTYTASLAIEGLLRASELMEIDLAKSKAAIIGATGDIGSISTKVLAKHVPHLILSARRQDVLERFADRIRRDNDVEVTVAKYARDAAKEADIILTATSSIATIINPEDLKPGAVLCDVSIPPNIAREVVDIRNDILVFEGGLAQVPNSDRITNRKWQEFFPEGIIFGCLAEMIILALEGKFENFSLGRGSITQAKVDEISRLARKHGFRLSDFRCGGKVFTEEDIKTIKRKAKERLEKILI